MLWRWLPLLVVAEVIGQGADKTKRMTSPGGGALACDPCASGSLVAHPRVFEQSTPLQTVAMTRLKLHTLTPMSEEQLKAFLEKVQADNSLQEKLKAAEDVDAVAAAANEAGFTITAKEIADSLSRFSENTETEASDQELASATGGSGISFLAKYWAAQRRLEEAQKPESERYPNNLPAWYRM